MIALIGAGGLAREIAVYLQRDGVCENPRMFVDDEYAHSDLRPISELDTDRFEVIIAIADPLARQAMVGKLPKDTNYFTFVHSSAIVGNDVKIGLGSCVGPCCMISTNINIGSHAIINYGCSIGHDCVVGNFVTTSPQVCLSGSCQIESRIYLGTNSSIREKTHICSDVTVGMHSCVIKSITSPGTYVGCPAKRMEKQ